MTTSATRAARDRNDDDTRDGGGVSANESELNRDEVIELIVEVNKFLVR